MCKMETNEKQNKTITHLRAMWQKLQGIMSTDTLWKVANTFQMQSTMPYLGNEPFWSLPESFKTSEIQNFRIMIGKILFTDKEECCMFVNFFDDYLKFKQF